jgi:hypothetical protein
VNCRQLRSALECRRPSKPGFPAPLPPGLYRWPAPAHGLPHRNDMGACGRGRKCSSVSSDRIPRPNLGVRRTLTGLASSAARGTWWGPGGLSPRQQTELQQSRREPCLRSLGSSHYTRHMCTIRVQHVPRRVLRRAVLSGRRRGESPSLCLQSASGAASLERVGRTGSLSEPRVPHWMSAAQ